MIIGDGLLGKAFSEGFEYDPSLVIFASGVSNSKEKSSVEFHREKDLLERVVKSGKPIVYFSTCSILDPEMVRSEYVTHKIQMEKIVSRMPSYSIFRLPQVVGNSTNEHTLTNYLYKKITCKEEFELWENAYRNLIDIDDVVLMVTHILSTEGMVNGVENIANTIDTPILELVQALSKVLNVEANYQLVNSGSKYEVDTCKTAQIAEHANVKFGDTYLENLVRKYYGKK